MPRFLPVTCLLLVFLLLATGFVHGGRLKKKEKDSSSTGTDAEQQPNLEPSAEVGGSDIGGLEEVQPLPDGSVPPEIIDLANWATEKHTRRTQEELLDRGLRLALDYEEMPPWLELARIFAAERQVIGNIEKVVLKVELISPIFWNRTLQVGLLEEIGQERAMTMYESYRFKMGDGIPNSELKQYERTRLLNGFLLCVEPSQMTYMDDGLPGEYPETWKFIVHVDRSSGERKLKKRKLISRKSRRQLREEVEQTLTPESEAPTASDNTKQEL